MITKDKSFFFVYHKATHAYIWDVEDIMVFLGGKFLAIYLGCPISRARNKKVHF